MHLPPDLPTAAIGAAIIVGVFILAARHAIRTAPYLDHESSADERYRLRTETDRLNAMPITERMEYVFANQVEEYVWAVGRHG